MSESSESLTSAPSLRPTSPLATTHLKVVPLGIVQRHFAFRCLSACWRPVSFIKSVATCRRRWLELSRSLEDIPPPQPPSLRHPVRARPRACLGLSIAAAVIDRPRAPTLHRRHERKHQAKVNNQASQTLHPFASNHFGGSCSQNAHSRGNRNGVGEAGQARRGKLIAPHLHS